jgi:hypothetical protein
MALVADEQDMPPASIWRSAWRWTLLTSGQVASSQSSPRVGCRRRNRLGHAVGAEDHRHAIGHLVQFLDEDRALGLQASTTKRLWTISCRT